MPFAPQLGPLHTCAPGEPPPQPPSGTGDCRRRFGSRLLPYGLACVVTVVLILLRYRLHHLLGDNLLPLTLELAVIISAWSGGLGPGLCATGLGALLIHYVFLPPYFSFTLGTVEGRIVLVSTVGAGVGSSLLSGH